MLTPSPDIIQALAPFAAAMTAPTFHNALILLWGTILAPGRRTVASALRVLGRGDDPHFANFHRFFNRAQWSPLRLSRLLLALLVRHFVAPGAPLILLIDETLERRQGRRLHYQSWFRDPVRSTVHHVAFSKGIRWSCLCLLVPVPWSRRPWALPFLVAPALAEKTCQKLRRPHRSSVVWAAFWVRRLSQWQPDRELTLVGDGAYAVVSLVHACQDPRHPVRLVTRLRQDAALYDPPVPPPPGKRGPKPKKGKRQPSLAARLVAPETKWIVMTLPWYGGVEKTVEVATGTALWHTSGWEPVPLRWVLVRSLPGDPQPLPPSAFFCSDPEVTPEVILGWFLGRWNIEVTFAELRAHLGFETQRQWSRRATNRMVPCLCGVFSMVVVLAKLLHPTELPRQESAWYAKEEATFSDALAAVRHHLWRSFGQSRSGNYSGSASEDDLCLIPAAVLRQLERLACYTT
jgi:hypothetical protein